MTDAYSNQPSKRLSLFYRRTFLAYLVLVSLATVAYGILNVRIQSNWIMGDWMTNYRGGFVRRGLTGEIALRLSGLLHLSPFIIVLSMQLFFYAVIFYVVWKLLEVSSWNLWVVLLVFSPATLAFHVVDPVAGFRKEDILLAGLGVLILCLLRGARSNKAIAVYVTVLCVFIVFSHEGPVVYFPYFAGALWIGLGDLRRVLRIVAVPLVVVLPAMYAVTHHPGNVETAAKICAAVKDSVVNPHADLCDGAISRLPFTTAWARADSIATARDLNHYSLYAVTGSLAFLPVLFAYVVLWRSRELRRNLLILAGTAVTSFAASAVLFMYATDWGRWIYIHLFCITLVLLMIDYKRQLQPVTSVPLPVLSSNLKANIIAAVLVLIYATCWDLPHVGLFSGRFGYFGLIHYVASYRSLHPQVKL